MEKVESIVWDEGGSLCGKQALAREVAYELIPFSQRRLLHATMAKAQEALLRRHNTAADRAEVAMR